MCVPLTRKRNESNIRNKEKTVWEDEKDFTLEVLVNLQNDRVYGERNKSDIFSSTDKMFKKVMVSVAISWYGVNKGFFWK